MAWVLGMSTLSITVVTSQTADAQPRWGRSGMPRAGACFYRDFNFRGDYFCAAPGEHIAFLTGGMNDQISSIRTFGDTEVTLFQDARFRGRWTRLEGDVRNLRSEGWNDRLSSIRVSRGWGRTRNYGSGRDRWGVGRIETREWREDQDERDYRGDRGGRGDTSSRYEPRSDDRRDNSGVYRNDPSDRRDSGPGRGTQGRRSGENADVVIRRLYQEILQREPDAPGLTLYRDRMNNENWSEQDVREALLKSPEYRQKSAAMNEQKAQEIVARAYRSVLGREPDPASRVYVDKILRERWTEADVQRALRDSPEFRNKR
jgi:hypothetical protein